LSTTVVRLLPLISTGRALIERLFPAHAARITDALGALTRDEQKELGRLCKKLGLAAAHQE
jgi:MarR family 2-MHQ and catechol resistance regulon transcriptional repressor